MSHHHTSRRSFLQGTAVAAGAAALSQIPRRAFGQSKAIRVLLSGDPFYYALEGLKDQFQHETGIELIVENLSQQSLQTRLAASFVSGEPAADVISVDQMWLGQYLESRWIEPLNAYVKADSDTQIADFLPETLHSMCTWRGQLGTLPVATYGQGVMVNTELAGKAGVDVPMDGGWTWAQYFDLVTKLNSNGAFGTVIAGQQSAPVVHMYSQLAASMGSRWFKQFPRAPWDFTPTINTPENREALTYFLELYKASPPEAVNYNWFDAGMRFAKGDIGMFYWWSAYFYLCRKDGYFTGKDSVVADKMQIVSLPTTPGQDRVVSLGGYTLAITQASNNKDEAWQYVKWATSANTQKAMGLYDKYGYQFGDFSRTSNYNDPDLLKAYPYLPQQLADLQFGNGKAVRPPAPVYTTLEGIYGLNLNKAISGQISVEAALSTTDDLFNNVLMGNFLVPYEGESFDDSLDATKALVASLAS